MDWYGLVVWGNCKESDGLDIRLAVKSTHTDVYIDYSAAIVTCPDNCDFDAEVHFDHLPQALSFCRQPWRTVGVVHTFTVDL